MTLRTKLCDLVWILVWRLAKVTKEKGHKDVTNPCDPCDLLRTSVTPLRVEVRLSDLWRGWYPTYRCVQGLGPYAKLRAGGQTLRTYMVWGSALHALARRPHVPYTRYSGGG